MENIITREAAWELLRKYKCEARAPDGKSALCYR